MIRLIQKIVFKKYSGFFGKYPKVAPIKINIFYVPSFCFSQLIVCKAKCETKIIMPSYSPMQNVEFLIKKIKCSFFNHLIRAGLRINQFVIFVFQSLKIILIFLPAIILYPVTLVSGNFCSVWWKLFLISVQYSGPVFIKLSQWASTRRDMFSEDVCNNLSTLQRNTKPHSWQSTCEVMEEAFGPHWKDMFVKFDFNNRPIGSGCVAQVYKAYLNCNHVQYISQGQLIENKNYESKQRNLTNGAEIIPVAVKVLHPGIKREFQQNLEVLQILSKIVEFLIPPLRWLSITDCICEFEKFMLSQIDLLHEAQMLEIFSENFKFVKNVRFPLPIRPLITSKVIVETWEEGIPISHYLNDDYPASLKRKLAEIGLDVLLKMVFADNFVHSDLHPGNILIQNARLSCTNNFQKTNHKCRTVDICDVVIVDIISDCKADVQFVILDCGLVSTLSPEDFTKFFKVFQAVVLGHGKEVGELFLDYSVNECKNPEDFKSEMNRIVTSAREDELSLGTVDVGKLLGNVFSLLSNYKIKLESNFSHIMLAIMVLEGLGRSLDPNIDILQKAKPYLLKEFSKNM